MLTGALVSELVTSDWNQHENTLLGELCWKAGGPRGSWVCACLIPSSPEPHALLPKVRGFNRGVELGETGLAKELTKIGEPKTLAEGERLCQLSLEIAKVLCGAHESLNYRGTLGLI